LKQTRRQNRGWQKRRCDVSLFYSSIRGTQRTQETRGINNKVTRQKGAQIFGGI